MASGKIEMSRLLSCTLTEPSGTVVSCRVVVSGHVGILEGYFTCENSSVTESYPINFGELGWAIPVQGVAVRDVTNGDLLLVWASGTSIETYKHSGTMVTGHRYHFAIPVRRIYS